MKKRVTICIDCDEDRVLEVESMVAKFQSAIMDFVLVDDPFKNFDVATDNIKEDE